MRRSHTLEADSLKEGPSAIATFFSLLVTLTLFLSLVCTEICVYMNGLATVADLPSVGNVDSLWMTQFFSSVMPTGVLLVFTVLLVLLLFFINGGAAQFVFLFCGVAFVLSGLLNGICLFCGVPDTSWFSPEFQAVFVDSARALSQLAIVWAFLSIAIGASMFSVCACICVVRRKRMK